MADYGIKVAKDGFNVLTAADKDLAFSSEFVSPKIFSTSLGSAAPTLTINSHDPLDPPNFTEGTVTHDLGYQPSFMVWLEDENDKWHWANSMGFSLGTAAANNITPAFCYTNTTELIIRAVNNSTTTNYIVGYHYVIFHDHVGA